MAQSTVIQLNNKRFSEIVESCNKRLSALIYTPPLKSETLYSIPFKIRVKNITVPGYSPTNVPPIGIAIIGFNNYIL